MPRIDDVTAALDAIVRGASPRDLESQTLDFKEHAGSDGDLLQKIATAALCFANASGGTIVVGVADKSSGAAALGGTTLSVDAITRRIYELSVPSLTVDAREERTGDARLVLVRVPQSPDIHSDPQGRAPRRVGRDCIPMTPADQRRLREDRLGIDWSASPSGLSIRDVLPAAVDEVRRLLATFADERKRLARLDTTDLLQKLGATDPSGRLLNAGAVLLASPPADAPWIVYRYQATPAGEPKAIERVAGPLVVAFRRALDLVHARMDSTPLTMPDGQQIRIEDFPSLAVREALANAVIHRDYHLAAGVHVVHSPELLSVTSPGPLVSGVTPENILTHPSKPRNPCLMRVARLLGLVEEIGRGIDRMYREMLSAGRGLPRIESFHDHVQVSFAGGRVNTQIARFVARIPEQEREDTDTLLVLFRLCSARTVTADDIAPFLQKHPADVEAVLRRLSGDSVAILEPTRSSARRSRPAYRLRGDALKALGTAVEYQRRTVDEIDRKVVAHVREYGKVTNRTVQNLLDVGLQRARGILADLVQRGVLRKTSAHSRGPGVEYGAGPKFPPGRKARAGNPPDARQLPLAPSRPNRRKR